RAYAHRADHALRVDRGHRHRRRVRGAGIQPLATRLRRARIGRGGAVGHAHGPPAGSVAVGRGGASAGAHRRRQRVNARANRRGRRRERQRHPRDRHQRERDQLPRGERVADGHQHDHGADLRPAHGWATVAAHPWRRRGLPHALGRRERGRSADLVDGGAVAVERRRGGGDLGHALSGARRHARHLGVVGPHGRRARRADREVAVRLLVIEDQPALLTMVASLLREAGHDVREASTVAAALSALDESLPEAVVLDLVLDAPSAALRERLRAAKLPALLVSGAPEGDARNAALAHGWDMITKPFEPEDLLARVARLSPTPHRRPTMPPPSPLSLPALPTV
ncbi:MAG: response regulator, partial [Cytophagia bacterium]|nr:response regulator [Cytophagia bacterium]